MLAAAGILAAVGACVPPLLPDNVGKSPDYARTWLRAAGGADFYAEEGLADGVWLSVARPGAAEPVSGYLSSQSEDAPALVLLLPGASSFYELGPVEKARDYHDHFAAELRSAGFRTWTLVVRECGTPYGGGDLEDTLDALDWLENGGLAALGAERTYLVGYSSGGTIANLVAIQRELPAIVSVSGLSGSEELERRYRLLRLVTALYPQTTGICQLGDTLRASGPPGSPQWSTLDVSGRVNELRSPMLVMHGERDLVFPASSSRMLQVAYADAVAHGAALPPVEFEFVETGRHVNMLELPDVPARVAAYLQERELERR
ncbi:MAG: alpha/beta fold hydrolase [Phycisphaerae bacterium]|jgi:pimeloyl-ACP methyl ester carboxylesterase